MARLIDETGNKYGKLTVVARMRTNKHGQARWLCECECGGEAIVSGSNLRSGKTKSCGCGRKGAEQPKEKRKPGPKPDEVGWKSTGNPYVDLACFIAMRAIDDAVDNNVKVAGRTRHPMKKLVIKDARKWLASEEGQEFIDMIPIVDLSVTGRDILKRRGICENPDEAMLREKITELIETKMRVTTKGVEGAEEVAQELMECFVEALMQAKGE